MYKRQSSEKEEQEKKAEAEQAARATEKKKRAAEEKRKAEEQKKAEGQQKADSSEKKEEEPATESGGSCTIYIECKTLLDHMDELKESKRGYVPSDGVILKKTTVSFCEGETVYDVLVRTCKAVSYTHLDVYKRQGLEAAGTGKDGVRRRPRLFCACLSRGWERQALFLC